MLDRREDGALLDHLARDVERQIARIDEPAHEAQIARQDLRLVGDEDALNVELDAAFAVGIEQVERAEPGINASAVYLAALRPEMNGERRLVELSGEAAVKSV